MDNKIPLVLVLPFMYCSLVVSWSALITVWALANSNIYPASIPIPLYTQGQKARLIGAQSISHVAVRVLSDWYAVL